MMSRGHKNKVIPLPSNELHDNRRSGRHRILPGGQLQGRGLRSKRMVGGCPPENPGEPLRPGRHPRTPARSLDQENQLESTCSNLGQLGPS